MINQTSFPVPAIRAVRVPLELFTKTTPGHRRIFTPSINNSFATDEKSLFRNSCSISLRVSRGILKLFVIVPGIRILPYYSAYIIILIFCHLRCDGDNVSRFYHSGSRTSILRREYCSDLGAPFVPALEVRVWASSCRGGCVSKENWE